MATLDGILLQLEKLNKLDGIIESINNLAISYHDILNNQLQLEERVNSLTTENIQLKNQVYKVNSELDRINQQALNSNIELAGVPLEDLEDTKEIAIKLIEHLGFSDKTIIKTAYRRRGKVNTAGLPQPIIVTITDKGQRDQILVARRNKEINSDIVLPNCTPVNNRPIYINEHLTERNKYLLARAKELKRYNKVSAVFVRNGFVIIKSNTDTTEIRITNIKQIDELNTECG